MTAGIAASGHPEVSQAAVHMLRAGGNAFDAVVAAGFVSSFVEPALTSLGGGGFLLARNAAGDTTLFDFFSDTPGRDLAAEALEPHFVPVTVTFPGAEQVFNAGRGSVAVPGTLLGLLHVHDRLGRIPLAEVLAPSISLARAGVPVNAMQAYFLELLTPIVTAEPEGRAIYAPTGHVLREGDLLRNPDLAAFLESLSEGARDLHQGALASRIARDMREGRGLLTEADLAGYRVEERRPLASSLCGRILLTNPPPSFGGSLLTLGFELLEQARESAEDSPAVRVRSLVAVQREVHVLRESGCLQSEDLEPAARSALSARLRRFSRGTTHVSVDDGEGNAASMTTSNGEGSGYVVPGTGIMLNNMMGEDDLHPEGFHASPPGRRVSSMMSPSMLVEEGRVRLVVGSGGSKRIWTTLLQVIDRAQDSRMAIDEVVEHPRVHWDGEQLQVEPGLSDASLEVLHAACPGAVNIWSRRDVYFGGAHAVVPGERGAGDPRRGGAVATTRD